MVDTGRMLFSNDKLVVIGQHSAVTVWLLGNDTKRKLDIELQQMGAASIFRNKLYIGTKGSVTVVDLDTLLTVKRYSLPIKGCPTAIALNSTRMLVGSKGKLLMVDLTLSELPNDWIATLANHDRLVALLANENVLKWRSSFDHNFFMAIAQHATIATMVILLANDATAHLRPNSFGECALQLAHQTSRGYATSSWPNPEITIFEFVTEMQIRVLGDMLFHTARYYPDADFLLGYEASRWFTPEISEKINWLMSLKMMYFKPISVIDKFRTHFFNINSKGPNSKVLLVTPVVLMCRHCWQKHVAEVWSILHII
jgi:hypothetical protein